jgi:hypothetical protein
VAAFDAGPWADFSVGMAGAGAALAGLLFVAVSINLDAILAGTNVASRAAQALVLLATPIFLALAVLIPEQPRGALGTELVVVGVTSGLGLAFLARPARRSAYQPISSWLSISVLPAAVVSLSSVLAGVGVLTESLGGLYWFPLAVTFGFLGGLTNAWVLLVEVRR